MNYFVSNYYDLTRMLAHLEFQRNELNTSLWSTLIEQPSRGFEGDLIHNLFFGNLYTEYDRLTVQIDAIHSCLQQSAFFIPSY